MRAPALAEAATQLPWLSPCAASLLALARTPASAVWSEVRRDPGCVLLMLRHGAAAQATSGVSFFPALVHEAAVLEAAVHHLEDDRASGFVDWSQAAVGPIYQSSLACARLAHHLAERSERCDPENAWVAGLLAPLGWLAVAAIDPDRVAACLADPAHARNPTATQQRHWGLDQGGIARRLCQHWQLPRWLAVVAGHLGLKAETAKALGGDPDLFLVVQLAVRLAQQQGSKPLLSAGATVAEVTTALGLADAEVEELARGVGQAFQPDSVRQAGKPDLPVWAPPDSEPLLRDLLRLAADNRKLSSRLARERLESDVDALHRSLEEQLASEANRLQAQKLGALAEFAAGAGHEINNPLAVISGQAQYLLGHEPEPDRQKSLQTIIGQTRRIHHLLSDLMQFARPPRPQKQAVDLAALVREVAASLQELAAQRQVRLVYPDSVTGSGVNGAALPNGDLSSLTIDADRQQVSLALACLLRNAIEAAPAEGWARVRLEAPAPELLELVVEDSGSGPVLPQREHLFDPFYSGRPAGRGRGLGLATAWRLAREHGGDVRFDSLPGGPTRFVLSLPRLAAAGSNGVNHH